MGPLYLAKGTTTDCSFHFSKWKLQRELHWPQPFSKRDSTARGRDTVCLLHFTFKSLFKVKWWNGWWLEGRDKKWKKNRIQFKLRYGCHRNYPGQLKRQYLLWTANWLIEIFKKLDQVLKSHWQFSKQSTFYSGKWKVKKEKNCHLSLTGPCRKQGWNLSQNWSQWEICHWFWQNQTPPEVFSIFRQIHHLPPISCPLYWGFLVFFSLHGYVYFRDFLLKFLSIATACTVPISATNCIGAGLSRCLYLPVY